MAESSPGTENLFKEIGLTGRTAYSSRLWLDNSGKRLPIAYVYDASFQQYDVFERVIKFWSDNSCLTFKKVRQSRCSTKQSTPALLLKSKGFYSQHLGIDKSKPCTTMSVDLAIYHETHKLVMNALGMLSYIYRNDSAQYISMNEENLEAYLRGDPHLRAILASYYRCHGKTQVLPTPFDYLSKLMPHSAEFGGLIETRPVYVTREPRHQYLLDHQSAASADPTFYDVLVINTLYKCPAEWASACSGAVPSCRNHGYLLKTCKCRCPPGFSGDQCQTKTGLMFPLQPGAFEVTVSTDSTTDFATLNLKGVSIPEGNPQFQLYIFIVIHLKPKKSTDLSSVSFQLPFKPVEEMLGRRSSELADAGCMAGLRLLWGSGNRLACDCVSSLVTNEPPSELRVFRARRPGMGMTLINSLSLTFRMLGVSEVTSQFLVTTQFRSPATGFRVAEKSGSKPAPVGSGNSGGSGAGGGERTGPVDTGAGGGNGAGGDGGVDGTSGDLGNSSSAGGLIDGGSAAAMKSALGGAGLLPLLVPLLSLLMLICMCLLLCRLKRSAKRMAPVEHPEEEDSESDSESSSDD